MHRSVGDIDTGITAVVVVVIIVIVVLVVVGGIWAGAWYYGSGILERTIDGWKAREAQAGRVYACATQTIGGFPFGIELRCADASAELTSTRPPFSLKARAAREEISSPLRVTTTRARTPSSPEIRAMWAWASST